ncbi:MAG: cell envelope integrity protein TolA, partial [Pseudomonadota bacterium]|nr:cell envelope integrity protein TolA [Pseudomonadota bacterium]
MTDHQREVTRTGVLPWKSPVALSVTLHLLILGIALAGWSWTSPDHEPPPKSISARLISQQQPEPSPVIEPDNLRRRDEERRAEEQRRKQDAERQKQEEEARRRAE